MFNYLLLCFENRPDAAIQPGPIADSGVVTDQPAKPTREGTTVSFHEDAKNEASSKGDYILDCRSWV